MESTIEHDLRSKKQKFLKEQILDNKDLDSSEFLKFMSEAKPYTNGQDIDNWKLEELVEKVEEFKTLKNQEQSRLNSSSAGAQNVRVQRGTSFQANFGCGDQNCAKSVQQNPTNGPDRGVVECASGGHPQQSQEEPQEVQLPSHRQRTQQIRHQPRIVGPGLAEGSPASGLPLQLRRIHQIPPVQSVDNRETFVQNFFNRLLKMPQLRASKTLDFFIKDNHFQSLKSKSE